jgi:hypothetical protein
MPRGPMVVGGACLLALALGIVGSAQVPASSPGPRGGPPGAPPDRPAAGPMAPVSTGTPVTFSKDVAPILYRNCTSCHRPGTSAPMSLLTYADARPYAKSIRDHVLDRKMPPWHADPAIGTFANERRLTDADRATLVAWANTGAREGDQRDLPAAPEYSDTWSIGRPDLVVSMPEEFEVPADGVVEYQWFVAATNLTEDKWIKAMEIRSTGASVVHHVVVFERAPEMAKRQPLVSIKPEFVTPRSRSRAPETVGAALLLSAGGTGPHVFPEGAARLLKAGTVITFQVHYTSNGAVTRDRSSIGFVFTDEPPREEIRLVHFGNGGMVIPPGAANHRVDAEVSFVVDSKLWSIAPHTHLRGKSFAYELEYPDGRREPILSVPEYDFEWQTEYQLAEPLRVPKGSRLLATAHYDNSRQNRNNPDPAAEVRWGDQTWEEMMFTWFTVSADTTGPAAPTQASLY